MHSQPVPSIVERVTTTVSMRAAPADIIWAHTINVSPSLTVAVALIAKEAAERRME
jgi:hypothetical protein